MGYSEAMRDVGAAFDLKTAVYSSQSGRVKHSLNFGDVLAEAAAHTGDETAAPQNTDFSFSGFSAGSAVEMLGTMSQVKEASFFDEFGDMEDLDSSISLDEIEELEEMAEIEAAQNNDTTDNEFFLDPSDNEFFPDPSENGMFLDPDAYSDEYILDDDDLLLFSELEDAI